MAQDLTAKKADYISKLVNLARDILVINQRLGEAQQSFFGNGFNGTGGAPPGLN